MKDDDMIKLFREPLGKYAFLPDCQLQIIEKEINSLNSRFKVYSFLLFIINLLNMSLCYMDTVISFNNYSFSYDNKVMGIVSLVIIAILVILIRRRFKRFTELNKTLKYSSLFGDLGKVTIRKVDKDDEELFENILNIYGITKEDFLKLYHN